MKKRILTFILCLVLALPLLCFNFACDNTSGNTSTQEMAAASADNYKIYLNKTFNNITDAADVQGYNGWYYYCGTPSKGNLEKMIFQASSGRWCSAWNQLYEFTYIWGSWLPDGQTSEGIGMSFMAPATGTLTFTLKIHVLCDTNYLSSQGVRMEITNKTGTSYSTKAIGSADVGKDIEYSLTNIKLTKGTEIFFMLYARNGNKNCHTKVDITAKYTGAY